MSAALGTLGAEIRARREVQGMTLRALARATGLSPSTVCSTERGGKVIGAEALARIAAALGVSTATRNRWRALAGQMPDDIASAILSAPERWDDLRAWLSRGAR